MLRKIKTILLSILLIFTSLSTMAMELEQQRVTQFDQTIDKLIFGLKQQSQKQENWMMLVKGDDPESELFLKNFTMLVEAGDEFKKSRVLMDFYIDYLYFVFLEKSLVRLKEVFHSPAVNKDTSHRTIQDMMRKFSKNVLRSLDVALADAENHATKYLPTISPGIFVRRVGNRNQYGSCFGEPSADPVVKLILTLSPINQTRDNNIFNYSEEFYKHFKSNPVCIHYFNQSLIYTKIYQEILPYITGDKRSLERVNNQNVGELDTIFDKIHSKVISTNSLLASSQFITNKIDTKKRDNAQKFSVRNAKKLNVQDGLIHIANEADFIQTYIDSLFPLKMGAGTAKDDWGDNHIMSQFNKNKQNRGNNKKAPPKKKAPQFQPKKENNGEPETPQLPSAKDNIPEAPRTTNSMPEDYSALNIFQIHTIKNHEELGIYVYEKIAENCDESTLCSLLCTSKSLHPLFQTILDWSKKELNEDSSDEEKTFDYDDWYQKNVIAYLEQKKNNALAPSFATAPVIPIFYGYARTFLKVVFGGGYQEVTTKHFNEFLKQAGGCKVKLTQNGYLPICLNDKSVETHYVLPNLSDTSGTSPYVLCLVHQPHASSIPFPRKTLYIFFKRDLVKAGYEKYKS